MIEQAFFAQHAKHCFSDERSLDLPDPAIFVKVAADYGVSREIKAQHSDQRGDGMFKLRGGCFQRAP